MTGEAYHYFLNCAYTGTNYAGSQIQQNAPSVMGVVIEACQTLFKRDFVRLGFASRTDAGVHAMANRVQLVLKKEIPVSDFRKMLHSLNALLPPDVSLYNLQRVSPNAHARYDATLRTYVYRIHTQPSPFYRQLSLLYPHPVRRELLEQMATSIIGIHDFSAFSKKNISGTSRICRVYFCGWHTMRYSLCGSEGFYFEIGANRFLRGMVRALVGTMLWIDRKGGTLADFQNLLTQGIIASAPYYAPSHGLYLREVAYDGRVYK